MLDRRAAFDWKLRTRTLSLGPRTLVMAIVNLTPDSFSGDGVLGGGVEQGVRSALAQLDAGADVLDLGAESTRPGATPVDASMEQQRLLPVLEAILRERPEAVISIDTYHASTAREAAARGAEIINDVSGLLWDEAMTSTAVSTGSGLVLMHTRGRFTEWKELPPLSAEEVYPLVHDGLRQQVDVALAAGTDRRCIVLDPGFGFGKMGRENFSLMARMSGLKDLGYPLLVGISRKGFLGSAVRGLQHAELPVQEARRTATTAMNVAAVLAGAHLLRVHEVQPAREAAAIADEILAG